MPAITLALADGYADPTITGSSAWTFYIQQRALFLALKSQGGLRPTVRISAEYASN
jgi:hypothetical protein